MRKEILAKFLNCSLSQLRPHSIYAYLYSGVAYFIATLEESNEEVKMIIPDFITSLDIDFIEKHLKEGKSVDSLLEFLEEYPEDNKPAPTQFFKDYDSFLNETIAKYGRGFFLCFTNKTEYQMEFEGITYYIYEII